MARGVAAKPYTEARLKEGLNNLRPLLGSAEAVRDVPTILAAAGVRMVIVEHLPQSKIDGAALTASNGVVIPLDAVLRKLPEGDGAS